MTTERSASNIYGDTKGFEDFRQRALVFIDLEMTGLDVMKHEIIEIACLVVNPETLAIKKEFQTKVQPEHLETADPKALEMTGFSQEAWEKAKPIKQVLADLNELAPGGMFAGWNIFSDMPFLEKSARDAGIKLKYDYHRLDVFSVAYAELFSGKKPKRLKLTDVCQVLDIPRGKKHTAMADIKATLEVYRHLRKRKNL